MSGKDAEGNDVPYFGEYPNADDLTKSKITPLLGFYSLYYS